MLNNTLMDDPERKLENEFVLEYVHSRGYTLEQARRLPPDEFKKLMTDANTYAAIHVAEVENRARMVGEIHGSTES